MIKAPGAPGSKATQCCSLLMAAFTPLTEVPGSYNIMYTEVCKDSVSPSLIVKITQALDNWWSIMSVRMNFISAPVPQPTCKPLYTQT